MDARGPKSGSLYVITERRRLADLIQKAILFHKEGLLCCLHPSLSEYKKSCAQKLAVLSSISVGSAKDILMMMSLRHNEAAWEFMIEYSALRIFDDSKFVTIAAEPRQGGNHEQDLLLLSFLKHSVKDISPNLQGKTQNEETELERITLQFTSSARELCVSMFLKFAAVVATLCSFSPQDAAFDGIKILDILDRYISSSWSSPTGQSQYHRAASHRHATSGWHLINVMFVIQVQELHFWIQSGNKKSGGDSVRNNLISAEDVKTTAHIICHRVLVEFFAWTLRLRLTFQKEEACSEFLETIRHVVEDMNEKLSKELGCYEIKPIPQDLLASKGAAIENKSPTMADISYDEMKMIPSLTRTCGDDLNWVLEDILIRDRLDNSPAFEKYSPFLKVANATRHHKASDKPVRLMSPEKTPGFLERGQSALKRSLSSNLDQQLARNWKRARKDSSMKRNTQERTNSATVPRSKTSSSVRSNYLCDGEVSDASDDGCDKFDSSSRQQFQATEKVAIAVLLEEADETNNAIEKLYESILVWPIFPTLEPREDFQKVPGKSLRRNGRPVWYQGPHRTFSQPQNGQNHNGSRASTDGSTTLSLRKKLAVHLLTSMEAWAEGHYERHKSNIFEDVTSAKGIDEYRRHWKAIILFEIRATVNDSIESLLPKCRQDPTLSFSADIDFKDFVSGVVEKVSPTRKLLNITCRATGATLFKKIATEFQGGDALRRLIHRQ